ncbi:MAG: diguanylate cyclase [Armatimonadetes bacterium]|nr:diguanylate cyclase [Armatimonadota bacterium]MBS1728639.1 GGDEF domain-containing protein [Armatimonadota bacterium]
MTVQDPQEQEAIRKAKQLIHISPKEAPRLLASLVKSYEKEGLTGCALQARRYQCYALMGNLQYERARRCLEVLFVEANEADEKRFVGIGEMYLGIIATELGEIDVAAESFDHAIRIGTELEDIDLIYRVQLNLGYAQIVMERYDEALATLKLTIRQFENGNTQTNAVAYKNIALATTWLAFDAAVKGRLTDELLSDARRSIEAARAACIGDFRLESLVALLQALYVGMAEGPEVGLRELAHAKESVFQRAALSVSLSFIGVECNLHELAKDWPNLQRKSMLLLRTMKKYRSLAQYQTFARQAARAYAELGRYKTAYRLLQESSDFLSTVRSSVGLHSAHIVNLRYDLEQRAFDEVILRMRNQTLVERNKVLEHEARFDRLSGVLNRRGIEESILEYADERLSSTLAIALLDIDFFKRINDVYGHATGDRVINEFATVLTNSGSRPLQVGRWGGEEFLALFDIESPDEMDALGEKLIEEIRRHPWQRIQKGLKVTASCGLAMWKRGRSVDTVTRLADEMMYDVKQNGRNGWRVASFDHAA